MPTISSITFVGSTGMLASLPAASLTHLNLQELHGPVHAPAASAALARLSNLQQLRIGVQDGLVKCAYSCLAGVAQLSRLTFLEVGAICCNSRQQLQQLLAQPLPLRVLRFDPWHSPPLEDLSQLTELVELYHPSTELSVAFLPQLQHLEIALPHSNAPASEQLLQTVMQLQRLRRTKICKIDEHLPLLHRLSELPALQLLALQYADGHLAAAAAPGWPQLPLCELVVGHLVQLSTQESEATIRAVAACASLTQLELDGRCYDAGQALGQGQLQGQGQPQHLIAPFVKLAGLLNLKHLCCRGCSLAAPGEAAALTALTGLTYLDLPGCSAGVGDNAAAAVAGSCQQLHHLGLSKCSLVSIACLSEVRHLTQLTELRLDENQGLTQQGLMLLTGLKGFVVLILTLNTEVTDEVVESFWAALKDKGPLETHDILDLHEYAGCTVFAWAADA